MIDGANLASNGVNEERRGEMTGFPAIQLHTDK